jgi:hypothetical protein
MVMVASRLPARTPPDYGMLGIVAFQLLVTGGYFGHVGSNIP